VPGVVSAVLGTEHVASGEAVRGASADECRGAVGVNDDEARVRQRSDESWSFGGRRADAVECRQGRGAPLGVLFAPVDEPAVGHVNPRGALTAADAGPAAPPDATMGACRIPLSPADTPR
jgi:hypothetical protein